MRPIPILETPRLTLRPHRREDLGPSAAMWADPRITRYIGGKPFSRQDCWFKILRYLGHWALMGYGYWAVEEKASARFVGELGFADFQRPLDPPPDGIPEIGWALVPDAHGQGYATEALRCILSWGDAHLAAPRTFCLISPANLPSLRLAEKLGYRKIREITLAGDAVSLFDRAR
jgi:RimJ/RimL family protein N-acetyltransferase